MKRPARRSIRNYWKLWGSEYGTHHANSTHCRRRPWCPPLRLGRRLPNLLSGLERSPRSEPLSFCALGEQRRVDQRGGRDGRTGELPLPTQFLFAHGAGAPSSSGWMQRFAALLAELGQVKSFDYPYMRAGADGRRRKAPDKLEVLIAAHREELAAVRSAATPGDKVVLAGKSMGGRVGCHVALEENVSGVICFGYPLRGQNGKLRDEVLLALRTPVLFVQGTRDSLCPLDELERTRTRMTAPSELFIVEGGDHSLEATKTALKAQGTSQADVERAIQSVVRRFS